MTQAMGPVIPQTINEKNKAQASLGTFTHRILPTHTMERATHPDTMQDGRRKWAASMSLHLRLHAGLILLMAPVTLTQDGRYFEVAQFEDEPCDGTVVLIVGWNSCLPNR